jgi:hypothetical protein
MRRHRYALAIPAAAFVAAVALLTTGALDAPSPEEQPAVWTSAHPSPTTHSQVLASSDLAPLGAYLGALYTAQAHQAARAFAAASAAEHAATASVTPAGSPAPPASTTAPPGACGAEDSIAPAAAARAEAAGVPCAWVPTAVCEEGGTDDAADGFFGIQEWLGYGGYAAAGAAPLQVQLGWESAHGQGPPDAPGHCHGY